MAIGQVARQAGEKIWRQRDVPAQIHYRAHARIIAWRDPCWFQRPDMANAETEPL